MFSVTLPDGRAVSTTDFATFAVTLRGATLGVARACDASGRLSGPAWVVELVESAAVWDELVRQSDALFLDVADARRAETARRAERN